MELDKKYTVQLTFNGLSIVDEKGESLNPAHVDHLLRLWGRYQQSWIYLCYGYSKSVHAWCYKIGFTNDVYRRMQQLRFDLVNQICGRLGDAMLTERHLQGYFMEQGKWLGGEFFDLLDEDVDQIRALQSFKDIRRLPTAIHWDYIAEWNRETVNRFKAEYTKGVTYAEWNEKRTAKLNMRKTPYLVDEST